jgi:hypothetical protein
MFFINKIENEYKKQFIAIPINEIAEIKNNMFDIFILFWIFISALICISVYLVFSLIYLLIIDGPAIHATHICYSCLKTNRIQVHIPEENMSNKISI